jgi:hypothetical protein
MQKTAKDNSQYFQTVIAQIVLKPRKGFALVPSANAKHTEPYAVGYDEHGHATWCECSDHYFKSLRGQDACCKHMQALDLKMQMDRDAASFRSYNVIGEALSVAMDAELDYEVLAETKHTHCPACGEHYSVGNCKPNFCYWCSFWTEDKRNAA